MRLTLDADGRFILKTVDEGGWELEVDGKVVHYALKPADALAHVADTLMIESRVGDWGALADITAAVNRAADVVNMTLASSVVAPILCRLYDIDSRRECVKIACLQLGGCGSEDEFRLHPHCREIAGQARAMLAPWFAARGM